MTDRRPIAARNTHWATAAAKRLAASAITPNQISMASMVAAAIAGAAFWGAGSAGGIGWALLLLMGAAFCQARLICNLLDGMVAVEGGKKEPDGPFWNEFPDRVADILILGGVGLGAHAAGLGFAAAALAVFTAYVRELGRAIGAPSDFSGPMAKQHRMAVITGATVLAIVWPLLGDQPAWVLRVALWLIIAGCVLTILRRARNLIGWLRRQGITSNRSTSTMP